jgi:hypothetical protein
MSEKEELLIDPCLEDMVKKIEEEMHWVKVTQAIKCAGGKVSIIVKHPNAVYKGEIEKVEQIAASFGYIVYDFNVTAVGLTPYIDYWMMKKEDYVLWNERLIRFRDRVLSLSGDEWKEWLRTASKEDLMLAEDVDMPPDKFVDIVLELKRRREEPE